VAASQPERRTQELVEETSASGRLVTVLNPMNAASEAYRPVRVSLPFARVNPNGCREKREGERAVEAEPRRTNCMPCSSQERDDHPKAGGGRE
jgi:hypothetical protein